MMSTTFGEQIRRYREAQGWTRKELAHRVGCAVVTVQKVERAERRPSLQMAQQMVEALAVPAAEGEWLLALLQPAAPSGFHAAAGNREHDALIGRDDDLRQIQRALLVDGTRLLMLTGPGGVGKTRLLQAAAATFASHFADGVATVELASLRHAAYVPQAVAHAVGFQPPEGAALEEGLLHFLAAKQLLLCLDNFEHLLESVPPAAAAAG